MKILILLLVCFKILANPWESSILDFERQDLANGYVKKSNLFIGSSSIRMWKLNDFFKKHTLNRGFGGSQVKDLLHYYQRVVKKYQPSHVVLYSGENDLSYGKSVQEVYSDFNNLISKIRNELHAKVTLILVKKSPARRSLNNKIQELNSLLYKKYENRKGIKVININTLLNLHSYSENYFLSDKLHFNKEAYKIISSKVNLD